MVQHRLRTLLVATLFLLFSFLSQSTYCQQKMSMSVGGVELSLGMKKDEVLKKYEGFIVTDMQNDAWLIRRKNPVNGEFEFIGQIQFIKGKLNSAAREWGSSEHESAVELVGSVYSALSAFTSESGTPAVIQTFTLAEPGFSAKRIVIHVNGRSVTITILSPPKPSQANVSVLESIEKE